MRVTAGQFRGRILKNIQYEHLRPTADVVKQALFNKLAPIIQDAKVLDLFCGTGALGIEAISRGAKEVVFVDNNIKSIALTKDNLKSLAVQAIVLKTSYDKALYSFIGKKFDIIILDPPYQKGYYTPALQLINEYNLLSDDGIIVCEHEKHIPVNTDLFELIDEKRYGIKILSYYTKKRGK